MKTIDIAAILGTELKSRASARDFATYLRNMQMNEVCVDFSRIHFVTRSFMDEFYQLLLKVDKNMSTSVHLHNTNEQVEAYLKSVEKTSARPRPVVRIPNAHFVDLQTVQQLNDYLASIK